MQSVQRGTVPSLQKHSAPYGLGLNSCWHPAPSHWLTFAALNKRVSVMVKWDAHSVISPQKEPSSDPSRQSGDPLHSCVCTANSWVGKSRLMRRLTNIKWVDESLMSVQQSCLHDDWSDELRPESEEPQSGSPSHCHSFDMQRLLCLHSNWPGTLKALKRVITRVREIG